jgi:diaminopimelate epimerase
MRSDNYKEVKYCIFDPTGNITALVETEVRAADRASVASGIMAAHPEVEQVGFVAYNDAAFAADTGTDAAVSLMMAGGEFCGNATMCAAALYVIRKGMPAAGAVKAKVSGAEAPLSVQVEEISGAGESPCAAGSARLYDGESAAGAFYSAAVTMPPAKGIEKIGFAAGSGAIEGAASGKDAGGAFGLPLVRLQGIDHIIIEPDSGFFGLKDDPAAAESIIRQCCAALGSDCLGMMFLDEEAGTVSRAGAAAAQGSLADAVISCERRMTPLVYVPGADTMFWENSCASGSAATGIWLAIKAGSPVDVRLHQPAGSLRVESDPATGITVLHGTARLLTQETYKC